MPIENNNLDYRLEFQKKLAQGIFIIGILFVLPIGIDHLLKGRTLIGLGCIGVTFLFSFGAWVCSKKYSWFPALLWIVIPFYSLFLSLAAQDLGLMVLFWCYPTLIGFHFLFSHRQGIAANVIFLAFMLPSAWMILEPIVMVRFVLTLSCVSGFSLLFLYFINKQQRQLETIALTDPLTGLLNRVTLQEKLRHMINQQTRFGSDMTLVSIDLDYFKRINDEFGHDQGDEVLINVSSYLMQRIRGVDLVFRMGGEEFLLLLFDCNTSAARLVAEEIREKIQTLSHLPNHKITASFGVASLIPQEIQKDWLKRCDENLYTAKKQGRNQVVA